MKILLVHKNKFPILTYDESERVVWWLGKALVRLGHQVTYLVRKGSTCPFADVLFWDDKKPLDAQIPEDIDVVHFHCGAPYPVSKPYVVTFYDNQLQPHRFDPNTIFVSAQHAARHGGEVFVYHGIDFEEYGKPILEARRNYFHFLGNAAWSGKNVRGAIDLAARLGARLHVIGGNRVNFRKGLRITLTPNVRFHGTLQPEGRNVLLNSSRGLLFPVIWHEPFGLAVPESLYFGCPVFGTPYGALPELLGKKPKKGHVTGVVDAYYSEFGCLVTRKSELLEAIRHGDGYNPQQCQDYAVSHFSSERMAKDYLYWYEKVCNGHPVHPHAPEVTAAVEDKFLPFTD